MISATMLFVLLLTVMQHESVAGKNLPCPGACSYLYMPVCGNDMKTYDNKCLLESAKRCEDKPKLKVLKDGRCIKECPGGERRVQCYINPCDFASCPQYKDAKCKPNYCGGCKAEFYFLGKKVNCKKCPDICPHLYDPVCGSNGKTYPNKCEFLKAKCKHNPSLKIAKKGRCEGSPMDM